MLTLPPHENPSTPEYPYSRTIRQLPYHRTHDPTIPNYDPTVQVQYEWEKSWAQKPVSLPAQVLRLEYFSDIPRMSGRTPDVQLRAIDATLCIIGHLAPNLGECPDVFLFCYNSNISLISCGPPTLRNGHSVFALSDNSHPTRPSSPMVSLFVMIQIFL